jgi:hypothetical protein
VFTVLRRPAQGAAQVKKSARLDWCTQFLTVKYDGVCLPYISVRMA